MGSNFVHYWLNNHPEDELINFDALTYAGNPDNLKGSEDSPKYKFIKGDIRDKDAVQSAMAGVEVVVHFAAETHVDRSILGPAEFVTTNVVGTQVLLSEAMAVKVKRFHHISTDEVFGSLKLGTKESFNENTPYQPRSPYSASKAGSDHLVRAFYETYGLPITISNASNYYGPYQFPEKFIPRLIIRGLLGFTLPVYGEGKNIRDWLYTEDHCRAIDLILTKGKVGETYLVGSNSERANIDVARLICDYLGISQGKIEFVKDRPGHDLRYAIDGTKLKTELGWQAIGNFEDNLKSVVEWYKNNEVWWRPLLEKAEIEKGNITL